MKTRLGGGSLFNTCSRALRKAKKLDLPPCWSEGEKHGGWIK